MSNALKVVLAGIILILASLFFMGICILNSKTGGPQFLTLALFVIGIIVSIIGLFFVRENHAEEDDDDDDEE